MELCHVRQVVFTGGQYRKMMVERSDAMLAIGGGKGTYAAGTGMIELGKPVLPLDLKLGSTTGDGDGAVALHRELATEPERFFPCTYQDVVNRVGLFSLDPAINDVGAAAQVSGRDACRRTGSASTAETKLDRQGATDRRTAVRESPPHRRVRYQNNRVDKGSGPLHVVSWRNGRGAMSLEILPQIKSKGNLDLLEEPLTALFCSQRCPGDLILKTYDIVRAMRDAGIPVIGGFQTPMEKECLRLPSPWQPTDSRLPRTRHRQHASPTRLARGFG